MNEAGFIIKQIISEIQKNIAFCKKNNFSEIIINQQNQWVCALQDALNYCRINNVDTTGLYSKGFDAGYKEAEKFYNPAPHKIYEKEAFRAWNKNELRRVWPELF